MMAPKKKTTAKKKVKRDIFDLLKAASRKDSKVGMLFLDKLEKGAKAKELYEFAMDLGYDGVRLEEFTKLLSIFKTRPEVKKSVLDAAY